MFSESQITIKERWKPKPQRSSKAFSALTSPVLTCIDLDIFFFFLKWGTVKKCVYCFISRMGINHLIWLNRRRTVNVLVFFKSMNRTHPKRNTMYPNFNIVSFLLLLSFRLFVRPCCNTVILRPLLCMCLCITPDSDRQERDSWTELHSDWPGPYTVFTAPCFLSTFTSLDKMHSFATPCNIFKHGRNSVRTY